jgi:predicted YcjX-like family ATPase
MRWRHGCYGRKFGSFTDLELYNETMTSPERQSYPDYKIETWVRGLEGRYARAEAATEIKVDAELDYHTVGRAVSALRRALPEGVPSPQLQMLFDDSRGRKKYYAASYPGENLLHLPGLTCELEETKDGLQVAKVGRVEDMAKELAELSEGELLVGLYSQTYADSEDPSRSASRLCDALEQARAKAETEFQTMHRQLSRHMGAAAFTGLAPNERETLESVLHKDERG